MLQVSAGGFRVRVPGAQDQIVRVGDDLVTKQKVGIQQAVDQDIPQKWRKDATLWTSQCGLCLQSDTGAG
jgi:hypothetical protein